MKELHEKTISELEFWMDDKKLKEWAIAKCKRINMVINERRMQDFQWYKSKDPIDDEYEWKWGRGIAAEYEGRLWELLKMFELTEEDLK